MRVAFFIATLCLLSAAASAPLGARDVPARDRITLCDGRTFVGVVGKLDEDGSVVLVMPDSGERLKFSITEIKALRFDTDTRPAPDTVRREFVFRLTDDTRITGRIVACDGAKFTLKNDCLGRFEVPMSAVTHVTTDYFADISGLRNDGPGCLFVLKNGDYARGELLPPAPAEEGGRVTEFKYKDGGKTRVLPLAQVCGLVMPAAKTRPAEAAGWYARVYLANSDLVVGTLETIGDKKIKLATPFMGEIEIGREYVDEILFTPTPRATYGRLLLCFAAAGRVIEYNELMEPVWSYATKRPCYATLLDNGNVLVCDSAEKTVSEVDRRGRVVWRRASVSNLNTALRLPNGNTIIPEYDLNAGRCLVVRPDETEVDRIFDIGASRIGRSDANDQKVRVRDVTLLPNGNLLICDTISYAVSRVVEADPGGRVIKVWGKDLIRAVAARRIANGEIVVVSQDQGITPGTVFMVVNGEDVSPFVLDMDKKNFVRMVASTPAGNIVLARVSGNSVVFEEYEITRNAKKTVIVKPVSTRKLKANFSLVSTRKLKANFSPGIINYECN